MQFKYKDYTFIDQTSERDLSDVITIYQLVDDLVDIVVPQLDSNYNLFSALLTVLDYYLNNTEYRDMMGYLSKYVSRGLLERSKHNLSEDTLEVGSEIAIKNLQECS